MQRRRLARHPRAENSMRLCRFNEDRLGVVADDVVLDVSEALDVLPRQRWPALPGDALIAGLDAVRARIEALRPAARSLPLSAVQLCAPVANPTKVCAAPVNYLRHLDEVRADRKVF